jgi:hypothetical protein
MRNPLGRGCVATFRWPSPRPVTIAPNCPLLDGLFATTAFFDGRVGPADPYPGGSRESRSATYVQAPPGEKHAVNPRSLSRAPSNSTDGPETSHPRPTTTPP